MKMFRVRRKCASAYNCFCKVIDLKKKIIIINCLYVLHPRLNDAHHTHTQRKTESCLLLENVIAYYVIFRFSGFFLVVFYWQCYHMAAAAALVICLPCSMCVKCV